MFGVTGHWKADLSKSHARLKVWRKQLAGARRSLSWLSGHVLGGALVGYALGAIGSRLPARAIDVALVALSCACAGWALHHLGFLRMPMPQLSRQVPRSWLTRLPWDVVALGYGVQLGSALATRIKAATTYAVFGCALVSGSGAHGALIVGAFGAARSLLPLMFASRFSDPHRALSFAVAFNRHERRVMQWNAALLVVSSLMFAAIAADLFRAS